MTTRTTTRQPPAQPALGFTFAPTRDNTAYAVAARLLPADMGAPPARPSAPGNEPGFVTKPSPARAAAGPLYATTAQRLTTLHSTYQAALNSLVDVLDVDPEAGATVRAADVALRALLRKIDGVQP